MEEQKLEDEMRLGEDEQQQFFQSAFEVEPSCNILFSDTDKIKRNAKWRERMSIQENEA